MCFAPQWCANGMHFFDISTSKSGPNVQCFYLFYLHMCFAPQLRALFRHLNFQKRSERAVFLPVLLTHVLRATTACTFSTSQLPKVVRTCGVFSFLLAHVLRGTRACTFLTSQLPKVVRTWCDLYILTWKCASCHNIVHFFDISTSKRGLKLRCVVHFDLDMCFAPQRRAIFHLSSGQLALHPPLFNPPEPQIIGKTM